MAQFLRLEFARKGKERSMKPSLADRILTIFLWLDLALAGWYLSRCYEYHDKLLNLIL